MANKTFVASWPVVPNATMYAVTWTVAGVSQSPISTATTSTTKTLSVENGDQVMVSVVASNDGGASLPGVASVVAVVEPAPDAPVVTLNQS